MTNPSLMSLLLQDIKDRPTLRICRKVFHNKKIEFGSSLQGLIEVRSPASLDRTTQLHEIRKIRSPAQAVKLKIAALNAKGCRPSRHSIFNVFKCFMSTGALTAFSCCAHPYISQLRISPESTRSYNQSITQMQMSNSSCTTSFHDTYSWLNCCPYLEHTAQHLRQNQSSCSSHPAKLMRL